MRRFVAALLSFTVLALAAGFSGVAMAATGSSTCQAYSPQACNTPTVQGVQTTRTPTPTTANAGTGVVSSATANGSLPFTGLDVALLIAGGCTLVGVGLIVRRIAGRV
jgi:hypothetical protein